MMQSRTYVLMPYGYTVRLWDGEDGFTIASCPELPGCHAQGRGAAEALRNIEDALIGYLALLEDDQIVLSSTDASSRGLTTAVTTVTSPAFGFAWARSA